MLFEYIEILDEIPNPEEAVLHLHKCIALEIPALDPGVYTPLPLGAVILSAQKVMHQMNGPHNALFAQRLHL